MKRQNLLKIALSLIFLAPIMLSVNAQREDKPLSFGVKIGSNSSGFTQNYEVFTGKRLGFTGGVFAEFKPIQIVGVSLEVNYSQQGAYHLTPSYIYSPSELNTITIIKNNSDIRLNTIDIPLLINFRPLTEGNITPVFTAGFAFDYILSAKATNWLYTTNTITGIQMTLPNQTTDNVSDRFKKYNYGPVFGLGIDFTEKQIKYSIGMRYSIGLNNIDNLANLNNVSTNSFRYDFSSNTLSILIGVGF